MSTTISIPQEATNMMVKDCIIENVDQLQSFASPSTQYAEDMSETSEATNIKEEKSGKKTKKSSIKIISEKVKIDNKMVEEDAMSTDVSRKTSYETYSDKEEDEEEDNEQISEQDSKIWDERRESLLKNLAIKCKHDWKKVAKSFNNTENTTLSPVALKQRFKKVNKGEIALRIKFGHSEDLKIVKYFDIYGCNWTQIATHFTDRTAIMLKNRYYSHIRKRNLYDSMLEEVKNSENDTTIETQEVQPVQAEQEQQVEMVKELLIPTRNTSESTTISSPSVFAEEFEGNDFSFFGEKDNSWLFRKLSMRTIDNIFDMDSSLTTQLHERITINYY